MDLKSVVSKLQDLAPLRLAEKWDNVGLLVEPSTSIPIKKVFLTNDLTEKVLQEAIDSKVSMIISYHPPIFVPFKRLTTREVKERIIIKAIEERIAIYSPHTAFDSVEGGVNDWLAEGLGEGEVTTIDTHSQVAPNEAMKVVVFVPKENLAELKEELSKVGAGIIGNYTECSFSVEGKGSFRGNESSSPVVGTKGALEEVDNVRLEMVCSERILGEVSKVIQKVHPYETPGWEVYKLEAVPVEGTGQGRLVKLNTKVKLSELVERVKKHLKLPHVRLALPSSAKSQEDVEVQSIALCAGSGVSVVKKVRADVYLTGEMGHHDVLAAVEKGTAVILCEHSNTERGFLESLKTRLQSILDPTVEVVVSQKDADPLVVV